MNNRAVPAGTMITVNFFPGAGSVDPAKLAWDIPSETSEITVPFSFKDVPLPGPAQSPAKLLASKPPATLPALAKTNLDVAKEVRSLLPQLSAITPEERQDAEIRLGLLPPSAFATVETIANDPNVPPAARQQLSIYLKQRRPLQAARLRRDKAVEDDQQLEETNALDAYGRFGKRDAKWDGLVREAFHLYYHTPETAYKGDTRRAFEKTIEAGWTTIPWSFPSPAFTIETTGGNPRARPSPSTPRPSPNSPRPTIPRPILKYGLPFVIAASSTAPPAPKPTPAATALSPTPMQKYSTTSARKCSCDSPAPPNSTHPRPTS